MTRSRARQLGRKKEDGTEPEYAVILPTYNERENLPFIIYFLIEAFKRLQTSFEILVVDDASPDGTAAVFRQLQQAFPEENLRLLEREGKLGLGSAYIYALQHTQAHFIFIMDADLSHNPKYIADFVAEQKRGNYDVVSGSRYIRNGGVAGWSLKRILVSRCANYLAQVLMNPRASDLTGSFRLYKREVLQRIIGDMEAKGYVFQMEILVRARAYGYSISEVPIIFIDRLYGTSKLGAGDILEYLRGLLRLFWTI